MKRLRTEVSEVRTLRLTKRGELARDTAYALAAAPALWVLILAGIAGLEGLGL